MSGQRPSVAVLFDFGGTLDGPGLPWKTRLITLYRAEGLTLTEERFDPVFYRADDALVGMIARTLPFRETVNRLVGGVNAGLGVADDALATRIAARFVDAAIDAVAASTPVLSALARRYRLGLVSNFYGNLEAVCADLGLRPLFDVIVDSACVGCTKPDPRIFRRALDELGIGPRDATFVGDSRPRDMAGARDVGMRHIWLVADETPPAPCCPGDRVVRSLGELPQWL